MAQARYDAVADFYIAGFDSTDDSVSRALLHLLGPVAGLRIIDVACGHGRITRERARRGANVVGIDISGALIRKAQEHEQNEPLDIRYIHADATKDAGPPRMPYLRCAVRSGPITGCCRPTSTRSAGTICG